MTTNKLSYLSSAFCLQCLKEEERWACRCPFKKQTSAPLSYPWVPATVQHMNTVHALQLYMNLAMGLMVGHQSVYQNECTSRTGFSGWLVFCVCVCVCLCVWVSAYFWVLGGFIFYMRCKCDTGKVSLGYTWYIIQASEEHYGNCVSHLSLFSPDGHFGSGGLIQT